MVKIERKYDEFYRVRNPDHVYPVEFVVRAFLGNYPRHKTDQTSYPGKRVLDLGFGDGRNMPLLTGWLAESIKTDWVGLGAGYACVASRHVGVTALNVGVVENGLAKIRFEAGWPGLVFYVIFILSLMLYCLRQALAVRDIQTRWFSSACATFLIVNLASVVLGTPFDASPTNVYIWFFTGFLARAPMLGQSTAAEPAAGRG